MESPSPLAFWALALCFLTGCGSGEGAPATASEGQASGGGAQMTSSRAVPQPDYSLPADDTHARWSRTIEPVLTVPSGSVVEVFTQEASGGQLSLESTVEDIATLDFDRIHALTGPIRVEGAQPGDVLAVTLHEVEVGEWGWAAIVPGFGFLADQFTQPYLKLFELVLTPLMPTSVAECGSPWIPFRASWAWPRTPTKSWSPSRPVQTAATWTTAT
ncbi:MAG: acetamidase/formamidase family protein [Longimicrobiales bacterium]|nr:acetamidase/formamidase family protein [Longimicrobiales bacterium]